MNLVRDWVISAFPYLILLVLAAVGYCETNWRSMSPLVRATWAVAGFTLVAGLVMEWFGGKLTLVVVILTGVAVGGFVLNAVGERRVDRQRARLAGGRCVRCGYDPRGTPTTRCPDCGAPCVARRPQPLD